MLRGFVVAAVLAASLVFAGTTSAGAAPAEASGCGQGSWVAGTVDLCAGELVYRDYVYDDFGARPSIPGVTAPQIIAGLGFQSIPTFDAYGGPPPGRCKKDQAQTGLIALRLHLGSGNVVVTAELKAMSKPNMAILAIAVDRDDNA